MVKKIFLFVSLIAVFCLAGIVMAQDQAKNETKTEEAAASTAPTAIGNKVCPVSGDMIKEPGKDTVEYQGKVYNLCCPMCKEEFLKDPNKYIAKVNEEMKAEEKTETPVQEKAETPAQEKAEGEGK